MKKSLRSFSRDFHSELLDEDDCENLMKNEKDSIVDFASAGLYIGGFQVIASICAASCTSIFLCWLLPPSIVSAVRTLVASSFFSSLVVYKAVRIGHVRGVSMLFSALRPCVFLYLLALTTEELGHANCSLQSDDVFSNTPRRLCYHIATFVMVLSAFARAQSPRRESDIPFTSTLFSLAVIAILPQPSSSSHGPLSQSPANLFAAGERVLRAVLFAFTYSMHVYASAPTRNVGSELLVCVGRAAAASVWILAVSPVLLTLFPFQVSLCIIMSLRTSVESTAYEQVPLTSQAGTYEPVEALEEGVGGVGHETINPRNSSHDPHDPHDPHNPRNPRDSPPYDPRDRHAGGYQDQHHQQHQHHNQHHNQHHQNQHNQLNQHDQLDQLDQHDTSPRFQEKYPGFKSIETFCPVETIVPHTPQPPTYNRGFHFDLAKLGTATQSVDIAAAIERESAV